MAELLIAAFLSPAGNLVVLQLFIPSGCISLYAQTKNIS
jgi:hypothetical protein